jgi:hypothetical protein
MDGFDRKDAEAHVLARTDPALGKAMEDENYQARLAFVQSHIGFRRSPQAHGDVEGSEGTARLEQRLEEGMASQELDPDLIREILALSPGDPAIDRLTAKLLEFVGPDDGPSPVMQIEDYYQTGEQPFTLRWPLAAATVAGLPMQFELLDRKTQFFVLFQEWTRLELEANVACEGGALPEARALFHECDARAEQLAVAELRARSYEGLMRVAEREGDRTAARQALDAAVAIREAGER